MDGLKPCPFCGGEDVSVSAGYWDSHGARYEVGCDNPQCEVHPYSDLYPTEAEAIEAWNTRAERTCELTLDGTDGCFGCSECDENIPPLANYCPNCGARVVE